jgi:hypothetical protein
MIHLLETTASDATWGQVLGTGPGVFGETQGP